MNDDGQKRKIERYACRLLATNDRREPGQQNWETTLGREGTEEVKRFLGLPLTTTSEPD